MRSDQRQLMADAFMAQYGDGHAQPPDRPRDLQRYDDLRHLPWQERELAIGRETQAGFFPDRLPRHEEWQLAARFHPAREVAGDFYDVFHMLEGTRIAVVVADVCDKGVGAGLFMTLIRSLIRYTASDAGAVAGAVRGADDAAVLLRALTVTNTYLITNHVEQGYFATVFFGALDPATGTLSYVNCGHNAPVVRPATGGYRLLAPTGPALGLIDDPVFGLAQDRLLGGDLLFAYTDGVTDARNEEGDLYSEAAVLALVTGSTGDACDLLEEVEAALLDHVGTAEQYDDITMVAVYRRPAVHGMAEWGHG